MIKNTINKKRLAKNTFLLYIRMLLVIGVTFFTTRIVLEKLGVSDYGIYNIIAGVVVMFAFLNKAMVTTTQRFLNFHFGKEDYLGAQKIFSQSLIVHILIAILIAAFAEIVGLWFLYNKMKFPEGRFDAAFWTLQLSVLATFFNILRTPYNACIIAYEKMNFYAYVSIVEVVLKLLIVYLLSISDWDKLIMYSVLQLVVSIVIMLTYFLYCNTKYPISRFKYYSDNSTLKSLLSFSGYSLLGNAANTGANQGVNMILNIFVGVIANASAGVSSQVNTGLYSLVSNFQLAFNPQIIKTYAKKDTELLRNLVCQTSRFSYYLMLLISVPVIIYCDRILNLWLDEVPEYSVSFCVWIILTTLITTLEEPLWVTVQASGHIKKYQIICSLLIFLNIPLTYIMLFLGLHPSFAFIAKFFVNILVYLYRYYYVKGLIDMTNELYYRNLLLPVIKTSIMVFISSFAISLIDINFIVAIFIILLSSLLIIFFVGMKKNEKKYLLNFIKYKF